MKSSKPTKYTGHMKIMNRVDENKKSFDAGVSKSNQFEQGGQECHSKKGSKKAYPEAKCICRK